jgi:AbrB family looped-hinge helix DNA binding protein
LYSCSAFFIGYKQGVSPPNVVHNHQATFYKFIDVGRSMFNVQKVCRYVLRIGSFVEFFFRSQCNLKNQDYRLPYPEHPFYNLTRKIKTMKGRQHMDSVSTTRMSSKGQVVIPESIRKQLNLKTGTQFVVVGDNDVIILKSIQKPSLDEFDDLIASARQQGKEAKLKKSDINDAISTAREKRK